ncbi:MAG: hypothetical protein J5I93_16250 [Pirellulaceae bacterium]|nr:hypothetical protein [Pirellulaceae bacterium]
MREVSLFVEDYGHAIVLKTLLSRLSQQFAIPVSTREFSATGGHGRVAAEFKRFLQDVRNSNAPLPDLIIVGTDSNCMGFRERKKVIQEIAKPISDQVVYCIPDPHIERWLLLDSAAFKKVVGAGCRAPDHKCERDRYKQLLAEAVRAAGQTPLLGGLEQAEDLVQVMDLDRVAKQDNSFGDLLTSLRTFFRQWA